MGGNINIRLILDAVLHRWKLVAVVVFIIPLLMVISSRYYRPPYVASAKLLIQESRSSNPFLSDLMVDLQVSDRFPVVSNVLRSRTVAESMLRELGEIDDHTSPNVVENRVAEFQERLDLQNTGGGVIGIQLRARTPEQAYTRLELVMETLLEEILRPQQESLDASVLFLSQQLQRISGELSTAQNAIREFREQHAEELPEVFEGNLQRYLDTLTELQQSQADLAVAERQLSLSEEELAAYAFDPLLGEMESDVVQARERYNDLVGTYTDDHPQVIRARRRLETLEAQLEQRRRNPPEVSMQDLERHAGTRVELNPGGRPRVVAGDMLTGELLTRRAVLGEVESLRYRIARLEAQRDEFGETVRSFVGNEQVLNALVREVETKSTLFNDLANRHQDAVLTRELTLQSEASRVWIIEAPTIPAAENRTPMRRAAMVGLLFGLVLAAGLIVLAEFLDRTVRLPDEAETISGLPTVAVMPKLDPSTLAS